MFARIKKSGKNQYLQIVGEPPGGNNEDPPTGPRHPGTHWMRSRRKTGSKRSSESLKPIFQEDPPVLRRKERPSASAVRIGPSLIFGRLWKELGLCEIFRRQLADRSLVFHVERVVFLTVLHRLFVSGSDRFCEKWERGLPD